MKNSVFLALFGTQSMLWADLPPKVFMYLYNQAIDKKSSVSLTVVQKTITQENERCLSEQKNSTPQKQASLDAQLQKEINRDFPNLSKVIKLLHDGANPNATDRKNGSVLIQSLANFNYNSEQIALALIKAGADANVYHPEDHMTPLMFAIKNRNHLVIDELIQEEADPTVQTIPEKLTALMLAAQNCDPQTTEKLLKRTFSTSSKNARSTIDYQDTGGNTALIWAVKNLFQCRDQETILSFLLQAGANIHLVNNEGKTALQLLDVRYPKARTLLESYDTPEAH
jgi:ankyrin repeat protein